MRSIHSWRWADTWSHSNASRWARMNSCGSPLAHSGSTTSSSITPFCFWPASAHTFTLEWFAAVSKTSRHASSLTLTEFESVCVEQKFWKVEELWNELLDVGHVLLARWCPTVLNAVKHPVGQVEVATLGTYGHIYYYRGKAGITSVGMHTSRQLVRCNRSRETTVLLCWKTLPDISLLQQRNRLITKQQLTCNRRKCCVNGSILTKYDDTIIAEE